jgi:hypothetical protein
MTMPLFMFLLFGAGSRSWAQEVISHEEPTPSSVEEITTPIERSFIEPIPRPGFFSWLKEQLKDTPAFSRDTKLALNLRSYYFSRDKFDDSVARPGPWAARFDSPVAARPPHGWHDFLLVRRALWAEG